MSDVNQAMTNALPREILPSTRRMPIATLIVSAMLVIYWVALFYGTHVKIPPGMLPRNSDKIVHFSAYAGLGVLLMTLRATRGPFPWFSVIARWFVLAGYGVFDELTQLLVARDAEVYDWIADSVGAALGLGLVTFVCWLFWGPAKTTNTN